MKLPKKNQKQVKILITSASKKIPLIKSIQSSAEKINSGIKVIAADSNINSISKYFAHQFWHMPPLNSLSPEDIIEFCTKNEIHAIIPTRDGELEFFAKNLSEFLNKNIHIMISPLKTIQICHDKLSFYEQLQKNLPVIHTTCDINHIKSAKYVVKERFGSGARKIAINVDRETATNYAKNLENPIFQPYIQGKEISVDFYVDKHNRLKGVIPRIRDYIVNGESQITHTINDNRIIDMVRKLTSFLTFYGHNMIQLIEDMHGELHILECNCRFGGASTLSVAAGLDSFYWFLLESLGHEIDKDLFITPKETLKLVRFPSDLIIHDNNI